ncbi:secondary thiamine-phosphate synthase enzyme YjbQ [Candidatus Marinimicrobia bacterium]|nr:secondary thiamine-phosphate synthase enzyme YjbQ [Candidatus Neomarinimicrobiota bacterium]
MWQQKEISLSQLSRGFHIITDQVIKQIPEIINISKGLLHIFIKHTSASLTINESADPTVRYDFETYFNKTVPDNAPEYLHKSEGPDDMPAHLKSSIIGSSISIPILDGELNLGTWQSIYLCEHRNYGGNRNLVLTIQGE